MWKNTKNEGAQLWIRKMDTGNLATAQLWVRDSFPENNLLADHRGGMGGTNADNHMIDAQFVLAEDTVTILIKMNNLEVAGNLGVSLNVMADTLKLL